MIAPDVGIQDVLQYATRHYRHRASAEDSPTPVRNSDHLAVESRRDLASCHGSIGRIALAHSWSYRSDNPICTRTLRGHYAYYGIAGNFRALQHVAWVVERYWRQMLSSRSRAGYVRWEVFHRIKTRFPLQRPHGAIHGSLRRASCRSSGPMSTTFPPRRTSGNESSLLACSRSSTTSC